MSDYFSDVRKAAVEIANVEVAKGVKESEGRNRGPEIDKYYWRSHCNPSTGYNWCGFFVNYCYDEAAKRLGKPLPFKLSDALWSGTKLKNWCLANWEKVTWDLPLKAGDIYVLYGGHIGMVANSYSMDEIFSGSTVVTIDGNQMIDKIHDPTKISLKRRHRDFAHMEYVIRI